MRVKITQKGWETYSENIGTTMFCNGVSVDHISLVDAMSLGSYVTLVEVNDLGEELGVVSPAQEALLGSKLRASSVRSTVGRLSRIQTEPSEGRRGAADVEDFTHDPELNNPLEANRIRLKLEANRAREESMLPKRVILTETDLEALASEKGINGLREIAEPMNVKGTSIKGMIAGILVAQKRVVS